MFDTIGNFTLSKFSGQSVIVYVPREYQWSFNPCWYFIPIQALIEVAKSDVNTIVAKQEDVKEQHKEKRVWWASYWASTEYSALR